MQIQPNPGGGIRMRPFAVEHPGTPAVGRHMDQVDQIVAAKNPADDQDGWRYRVNRLRLLRDYSPIDYSTMTKLDGSRVRGGPWNPGTWTQVHGSVNKWLGVSSVDPDADAEEVLTAWTHRVMGSGVRALAAEWSEKATRVLHEVLPTPVALRLVLPSEEELLRGEQVRWMAHPNTKSSAPGGGRVWGGPDLLRLDQLSFAERRWAILAIMEVLGVLDRTSILIVDEPERGLHRAAEAVAMQGLARMTSRTGTALWAATHSPHLLSRPDVAPVKVSTDGRSPHLRSLDRRTRETLLDLGLNPTDVLSSRRGFLFVEGVHDELVLETLLGDELEAVGVEVLPLHGGTKLPG